MRGINIQIISLVGLLLGALLLSGCFPPKKGKSTEGEATPRGGQAASTESEAGEEEKHSGTLEKMMSLGLPLKCSWKRDDNYYGTAYVKGEQSYSEISMEGKTAKVIVKDDCMWNWQEGDSQGFKMCFEDTEIEEDSTAQDQESTSMGQMQPPADINYNCQPAVLADSKFDPPSGVKFMTMEEMMRGAMEGGP